MMIAQRGNISLRKTQECFSKVLVLINLKVMILIPLNNQNQFLTNCLAVKIQLIELTIQSIEFDR